MKIYLATDHAGFKYKEFVKEYLKDKGFLIEDFGAKVLDENDNYTDFIIPCMQEFSKKFYGKSNDAKAIIFGGSGTGEAIAANKFHFIRAGIINSENIDLVKFARMHNDINVLSVGARFIKKEFLILAIETFLNTEFEGGRHFKRVLALDSL
jgi:ribose 5-phosphate isomerase B